MDLFEAAVLAELLCRSGARDVLLAPDGDQPESADQRRLFAPSVLANRVRTRGRQLGDDLVEAQRRAKRNIAESARLGFTALAHDDPAYPSALVEIPDPPPVLWLDGEPALLQRPAVALIGSRTGSVYACEVATELGADLSARGVVVVSGMASSPWLKGPFCRADWK